LIVVLSFLSVAIPDDIGEILEEMAKEERGSHSQMGAILIEEAIQARQARKKNPPTSKDEATT
jgi:hypothetical protein